ncbi:MAG TPA: vgr related protein [Novosphingobium sp.]|nr:vgr related protein [Novosphingobium sp.]
MACPAGGERPLTVGEVALVRSVFGDAVDPAPVRIRRRRWFPFQPRRVTMAPMGHLHFHPLSANYCDDFSAGSLGLQGHFIHEMAHVWQVQKRGRFFLLLKRRPWTRYDYTIKPGWKLSQYGLEQQAEIVRHLFLLRHKAEIRGAPPLAVYEQIVRFGD